MTFGSYFAVEEFRDMANKHANSFMGKYHKIKIGEKVLFLMLLDFSYVQSSSSITRHIDNDIWKLLYS